MKLQLQRVIDRWAGSLLCAMLSAIPRPRDTGAPPRSILVILLSEMGSLVLAQPMFARLRERYPRAAVHVLLFEKNREILDIMGTVPAENIHTLDDGGLVSLAGDSLRAIRRLRRIGIGAVIDCELFARVSAVFSRLTGAPVRVGFHRHTQEGLYRGGFINRPVLYNPYHHLSQQFLTLVEALETPGVPRAKRPVGREPLAVAPVRFDSGENRRLMDRFGNDFPRLAGRQLVLLYPSGGILPIRSWPVEYYRRLVADLVDRGFATGIIGMASDRQLARSIIAGQRRHLCVNLAGYTRDIRELMILFEHASLLVTNDGGPGQFAPLTPVPSIVFFGPETPQLYAPLGPRTRVLYAGLSCSPCLTAYNHRNSPCDGDNRCLKEIHPAGVLELALEILADSGRRLPA